MQLENVPPPRRTSHVTSVSQHRFVRADDRFAEMATLPQVISANVSAVHDVPEPGEAWRRHVRRLELAKLHGAICGGKPRRTARRCVK